MYTGTSRSLFAGLALAALLLVLSSGPLRTAETSTFNPLFSVTASQYAPHGPTDVTYTISLEQPDAMPAEMISFTPDTWNIAGDADVPDGAVVGGMEALLNLGLINAACNTELPVSFDLWDATSSQAVLVDHEAANEDSNGNGLVDAVEFYPSRLTWIFPGVTPVARYYGWSIIAGMPSAVHVLVYAPGQTPGLSAESFAEVLVLDLWDPVSRQPLPITDWCTPLALTRTQFSTSRDNPDTIADEGGRLLRASGAPGPDVFTQVLGSLGDADSDGIENRLDTCPGIANAGNPRVAYSGDLDGDGLDAACDPNAGGINSDEDSDGYLNRQDNCPLVMNGEALDNQADADGDDIGDDCDSEPQQYDGHQHEATLTDVVVIGGTSVQGDVNCDSASDAVDAQLILMAIAGLPGSAGCIVASGDTDCDGDLTAVDALGILRYLAGLPFEQEEPCPNIGAAL